MTTESNPGGVDGLVSEYLDKKIDRRQFVARSALLGITFSGAAAILAACQSSNTGSTSTSVKKGGTFVEGYDREKEAALATARDHAA